MRFEMHLDPKVQSARHRKALSHSLPVIKGDHLHRSAVAVERMLKPGAKTVPYVRPGAGVKSLDAPQLDCPICSACRFSKASTCIYNHIIYIIIYFTLYIRCYIYTKIYSVVKVDGATPDSIWRA